MALASIEIRERKVEDGFLSRMGQLGAFCLQEGVFGVGSVVPQPEVSKLPTPSLASSPEITVLPEKSLPTHQTARILLPENNIPLLSATIVSRAKHIAIEVQPGRVLSTETYNYADAVDAMFAQAFLAT